MRRRDLLRWSALAGVLPAWSSRANTAIPPAPAAGTARCLVLVELKGGNDGLNTLVPFTDPEYFRVRPRLAIARDRVLALDDRTGLHPALRPLMPAREAGELAWVQGVGYAEPNRSHFRSMDIWETASDRDEVLETGWIARAGPGPATGALPDAVILGGDEGPTRGGGLQVVTLRTPEQFAGHAARLKVLEQPVEPTAALAHILAVRDSTRQAGTAFRRALEAMGEAPAAFPQSALGRQLQEVARMRLAGMEIPVFKVRIGSFDTHNHQAARHDRLLTQLAEALAAFRETLDRAGQWDRVLVMSYSEFGRRVVENASLGTDHGTAAPHLVLGGRVKGGLYGDPPDLTALDGGDLRYTTDFRRLYSTVAARWWGMADPEWQERFPVMGWV